jgi:hypothetical protein
MKCILTKFKRTHDGIGAESFLAMIILSDDHCESIEQSVASEEEMSGAYGIDFNSSDFKQQPSFVPLKKELRHVLIRPDMIRVRINPDKTYVINVVFGRGEGSRDYGFYDSESHTLCASEIEVGEECLAEFIDNAEATGKGLIPGSLFRACRDILPNTVSEYLKNKITEKGGLS